MRLLLMVHELSPKVPMFLLRTFLYFSTSFILLNFNNRLEKFTPTFGHMTFKPQSRSLFQLKNPRSFDFLITRWSQAQNEDNRIQSQMLNNFEHYFVYKMFFPLSFCIPISRPLCIVDHPHSPRWIGFWEMFENMMFSWNKSDSK